MPTLTGQSPYFEVFDMNASIAFYRDLLGFDVLYATPEVESAEGRFSHFVRVGRGAIDLMLNTAYDSNERPPDRCDARWAGCRHVALYIDCDEVEALYAEMTARGLEADPPAITDYGYLGFSVRDPDGYGLTFHTPPPGTDAPAAA